MGLVIGAFTTLAEAERAARALLDAGFAAERMTAVARLGSGRLRLAERIAVHPVAEPARLVNRTERAGRSALLGGALGALLAAAMVVLLLRMGVEPLAPLLLAGAVLLGGACAGGLAALARRGTGLPHDLAFRYSLR